MAAAPFPVYKNGVDSCLLGPPNVIFEAVSYMKGFLRKHPCTLEGLLKDIRMGFRHPDHGRGQNKIKMRREPQSLTDSKEARIPVGHNPHHFAFLFQGLKKRKGIRKEPPGLRTREPVIEFVKECVEAREGSDLGKNIPNERPPPILLLFPSGTVGKARETVFFFPMGVKKFFQFSGLGLKAVPGCHFTIDLADRWEGPKEGSSGVEKKCPDFGKIRKGGFSPHLGRECFEAELV